MQRVGVAWIAACLITILSAGAALAAPPSAVVTGPASGQTGAPVSFDASGSSDPDGQPLSFAWSIDGEDVGVEHDWLSVAFAHPGAHVVALTVTDLAGATATATRRIAVSGRDRSVASLHPLSPVLPNVLAAPELVLRPVAVRARVRSRRLRVEVRCRRALKCAGTVRAVALVGGVQHPLLLAQRHFKVTRGGPRIVHVKLGRRALRLLARHRHVRVTAYRGRVRIASIWATYAFRVPRASARQRHG